MTNTRPLLYFTIFLALLSSSGTSGYDIEDESDLVKFSERVNAGNTFQGITVFLRNDLDMYGIDFDPIGQMNDYNDHFMGVFDGQGHVISNLNITSSKSTVGLFGYCISASVKNVILDSSCATHATFTNEKSSSSSSSSSSSVYVGSVAGLFNSYQSPAAIENIINMGCVVAANETSGALFLGGIIGSSEGFSDTTYIKNCVNLGDVVSSAVVRTMAAVGGIAGGCFGNTVANEISNSYNNGRISASNSSSDDFSVFNYAIGGGIVGYGSLFTVYNCVNKGNISAHSFVFAGCLVGYGVDAMIRRSYYLEDIGLRPIDAAGGSSSSSTALADSYPFDRNFVVHNHNGTYSASLETLLNAVVDVSVSDGLSRWALNRAKNTVSFKLYQKGASGRLVRRTFSLASRLVLLISVEDSEKMHFDGWYSDPSLTTLFREPEFTANTSLYGTWSEWNNEYNITFDTGEASSALKPITAPFGTVVSLPRSITRQGNEAVGSWVDPYGLKVPWDYTVPAYDVRLTAVWIKTVLSTAEDVREFAEFVNAGIDCDGLTVYLNNDIDMAGVPFTPIGLGLNTFSGTFDGRGHTLSHVNASISYQVTGFFRYSLNGMTVRNVVFGEGCDLRGVYGDFSEHSTYIGGGIVGLCTAIDRGCVVENLVSIAHVSFTGEGYVYRNTVKVGGVAGSFVAQSYESKIVNTAFLGTLSFAGEGDNVYIGGLIGSCSGSSLSSSCTVENSMSINSIVLMQEDNDDVAYNVFMGGFAGVLEENSIVRNCASINNYVLNSTKSRVRAGGIAGYASGAVLNNCYWNNVGESKITAASVNTTECTEGSDTNPAVGSKFDTQVLGCSAFNNEFSLASEVTAGSSYVGYSLISALNAYATEDPGHLARWVLNRAGANISFVVEREDGSPETVVTCPARLLLCPIFSELNASVFYGWYNESTRSPTATLFAAKEFDRNGTTLYGMLKPKKESYAISFDLGNMEKSPRVVMLRPGERILPNTFVPEKKGLVFTNWANEYSSIITEDTVMPKHDVELHALWLKTTISTKEELALFSAYVNAGVSCEEQTVYLGSDIDMAGVSGFEPIGNDFHPFLGTFEGQGYRISNLRIENSGEYVGLFGISYGGADIRNIFLDETCTVVNTFFGAHTYEGSIIGYCYAKERDCVVINAVNFGKVVSVGESEENSLTIGGIVGGCKEAGAECLVHNCANYGSVTHSGSTGSTHIGGIIGECAGSSTGAMCRIWNNLNYGTLVHAGVTHSETLEMGGIIGACALYTSVSGCANAADIVTNQRTTAVNAISGKTDTTSSVTGNLWYEETTVGDYTGLNVGVQKDLTTEDETDLVEILSESSKSLKLTQKGVNYNNNDNDNGTKDYTSNWVINWGLNDITLFINGRKIASYRSRVILLPKLFSNAKYRFTGWYQDDKDKCEKLSGASVTTESVTFYGSWELWPDGSASKWWISCIILSVILVVLVALALLYIRGYAKQMKRMKSIQMILYPLTFDAKAPEGGIGSLKGLYPDQYTRPTMKEALYMAGLNSVEVEEIVKECYEKANKLYIYGTLPSGVTVDDAAAIAMYTFDFGPLKADRNPYHLINTALAQKDLAEIQKIKDILYLVMSALRKLPVVHGKYLNRGIRAAVLTGSGTSSGRLEDDGSGTGSARKKGFHLPYFAKRDKSGNNSDGFTPRINDRNLNGSHYFQNYSEGSTIAWHSLSSTSPSMSVTKSFLAKGSRGSRSAGTLFIIEGGWGYNISQFSLYPSESEILLEPERQFEVLSTIRSECFTVIKLRMLKTPLVLPDVFGRHPLKVPALFFAEERYTQWKKKRQHQARLRAYKRANGGKLDSSSDNSDSSTKDIELEIKELEEIVVANASIPKVPKITLNLDAVTKNSHHSNTNSNVKGVTKDKGVSEGVGEKVETDKKRKMNKKKKKRKDKKNKEDEEGDDNEKEVEEKEEEEEEGMKVAGMKESHNKRHSKEKNKKDINKKKRKKGKWKSTAPIIEHVTTDFDSSEKVLSVSSDNDDKIEIAINDKYSVELDII